MKSPPRHARGGGQAGCDDACKWPSLTLISGNGPGREPGRQGRRWLYAQETRDDWPVGACRLAGRPQLG